MATIDHAKYFLVTGGTGGIGSELCRLIPSVGFIPIIGYCNNEKQARALSEESGGFAVKIDLNSNHSILGAIDEISSRMVVGGSLAGVVLGASPAPDLLPLAGITSEMLINQLRINVVGSHFLLSGLIKHFFKKNKFGIVIGILSQAIGSDTQLPTTSMGSYVIAKGALKSMLQVCAAEYSWLKVRAISPGFTKTRMLDVFDPRYLELAEYKAPFLSPLEVAKSVINEILL